KIEPDRDRVLLIDDEGSAVASQADGAVRRDRLDPHLIVEEHNDARVVVVHANERVVGLVRYGTLQYTPLCAHVSAWTLRPAVATAAVTLKVRALATTPPLSPARSSRALSVCFAWSRS